MSGYQLRKAAQNTLADHTHLVTAYVCMYVVTSFIDWQQRGCGEDLSEHVAAHCSMSREQVPDASDTWRMCSSTGRRHFDADIHNHDDFY